jgi:DNA-binding GntR family transcriptional regulator
LAEKFKVSRTPVKDALNMLEKEGYVGLRHNKGYYVAEIGSKEAEELYDIREAIENVSVQKAIEKLNRESLKLVKQAMEAYSEDVDKRVLSRRRLILDADFHLKIAEITGNKSLVEILRMIFSKIYLKHRVENLSPERSKMADKEHMEIYQAICSKQASVAVKIIRKHITLGRKNVLGSLVGARKFG